MTRKLHQKMGLHTKGRSYVLTSKYRDEQSSSQERFNECSQISQTGKDTLEKLFFLGNRTSASFNIPSPNHRDLNRMALRHGYNKKH